MSPSLRVLFAALALSSPALADDAADIDAALAARSAAKIEAVLADPVRVGPLLFHDAACKTKFATAVTVTGADRHAAAECLASYDVSRNGRMPLVWYDHRSGSVFAVTASNHKVTAIGPVDPRDREAALPTFAPQFAVIAQPFKASDKLRATLDKLPHPMTTRVDVKSCRAGKAPIASRVVHGSGIAAFDAEAAAYVAHLEIDASVFTFDGQPVTNACLVWSLGHAPTVKDLVQPVHVEKQQPGDDDEGVEGGVEGGMPPPPPPPPPPAPPRNVSPATLEAYRIAGSREIPPDLATKKEITADKKAKVIGSFKLCVDREGNVSLVSLLKSTGYPDYDTKLAAELHRWRYKAYEIDGKPTPVCTAVTFIYSQK